MVFRGHVGFIGGFLLLVQNDKSDTLKRRENRRPRAKHNGNLAASDSLESVEALSVGKSGMNDRCFSPKRNKRPDTVCLVSAISGTSTMTVFPSLTAFSQRARITRVFPLPVTP